MFTDHQNREAEKLQAEAERKAKMDTAFTAWLAKPETKLIVSSIPPAENPDTVQVVLRSAFDAGASAGTVEIMGLMLDAMLKKPPRAGF